MSEEQLKAADTDATLEQDYAELSDEELAGVAGGVNSNWLYDNTRTGDLNRRNLDKMSQR